MKATTMNGKYRVISCNDGSLDGSGYDHITIARAMTCPMCGQSWFRTFKYTSGMENADMYPYDTEPYDELRYVEEHCPNCREAARQNTYFFADKTYTVVAPTTYTLHVEAANNTIDFTFQSIETAKTVAELLWNDSVTDYITITNNNMTEVLYDATLPF